MSHPSLAAPSPQSHRRRQTDRGASARPLVAGRQPLTGAGGGVAAAHWQGVVLVRRVALLVHPGGGRTYTSLFDPVTLVATERWSQHRARHVLPGHQQPARRPHARSTAAATPTHQHLRPVHRHLVDRRPRHEHPARLPGELRASGRHRCSRSAAHGQARSAASTPRSGPRPAAGACCPACLSRRCCRPTPPANAYYSNDSHFWLLPAGNGKVFHAGPGFTMHWIDTRGNGSVTSAGPRGDDEFSINGNVTMYDIGRILKNGGAAGYDSIERQRQQLRHRHQCRPVGAQARAHGVPARLSQQRRAAQRPGAGGRRHDLRVRTSPTRPR